MQTGELGLQRWGDTPTPLTQLWGQDSTRPLPWVPGGQQHVNWSPSTAPSWGTISVSPRMGSRGEMSWRHTPGGLWEPGGQTWALWAGGRVLPPGERAPCPEVVLVCSVRAVSEGTNMPSPRQGRKEGEQGGGRLRVRGGLGAALAKTLWTPSHRFPSSHSTEPATGSEPSRPGRAEPQQ